MIEVTIAPIEIREQVWELYQEYAQELAQYYDEKDRRRAYHDVCFDEYWEQDNRTPFVIIYDHELIGFCLLTDAATHYMIDEFYIKPIQRGRGFGGYAVERVLDHCRQQGRHTTVGANVQVGNTGAIAFWKSVSFHDTGRRTRMGHQRLVETEADLKPPSGVLF